MKRGNGAIGVLLILIGLISNPWCLSWLFSNDGEITTLSLIITVLSLDFLFVIFGTSFLVFQKNALQNLGLLIVSTWFTVAVSVLVDRTYGSFIMPETADLLYPSYSRAHHETSEFDLLVNINNLGFRGSETKLEKSKKRVLLIGDSFTFGWGVDLNQTWISLLTERYPDVEFLNLGQGGNHPGDYVQVAKRAIPLLNPDLIIVGVLQGNDIHQLMRVIEFEETSRQVPESTTTSESSHARFKRYLGLVFPNLTRRFAGTTFIQGRWQSDAKSLLEELNESQQSKYNSLDVQIRKDFENGLLNPSLIHESMHHPNILFEAVDTANLLCKKAIIRLHGHLLEMDSLATNHEAELVVVSVPNRPYGFLSEIRPLEQLGFNTSGADILEATLPTKLAIESARLIGVYPSMQGDSLFYTYDGHWNAAGNRIFAKQLIEKLDSLPEWKHFLTSSSF